MDKLLYAVFSVYRYTRTSDSAYAMFFSYNYICMYMYMGTWGEDRESPTSLSQSMYM